MGTCCTTCLAAKVRDYARNAENGAVTVTIVKNPPQPSIDDATFVKDFAVWLISQPMCDVCWVRPAEFTVSFFPKK